VVKRFPRGWSIAPPGEGLPAPVAFHQDTPRDRLYGGAVLLLLFALFGILRGVDWRDPVTYVFLVGGPVLLASGREALATGPGWLKEQRFWGGFRWVRSDRLVRVQSTAAGTAVTLRLQDDEGRVVEIEQQRLLAAPAVLAQVSADVRLSLARDSASHLPPLDIDPRARTILLGDPVPPLRQRMRRRWKAR
jgi:hypothetical protein